MLAALLFCVGLSIILGGRLQEASRASTSFMLEYAAKALSAEVVGLFDELSRTNKAFAAVIELNQLNVSVPAHKEQLLAMWSMQRLVIQSTRFSSVCYADASTGTQTCMSEYTMPKGADRQFRTTTNNSRCLVVEEVSTGELLRFRCGEYDARTRGFYITVASDPLTLRGVFNQHIVPPYVDAITGDVVISIACPVYAPSYIDGNGKKVRPLMGVQLVDLSLNIFSEIMASFSTRIFEPLKHLNTNGQGVVVLVGTSILGYGDKPLVGKNIRNISSPTPLVDLGTVLPQLKASSAPIVNWDTGTGIRVAATPVFGNDLVANGVRIYAFSGGIVAEVMKRSTIGCVCVCLSLSVLALLISRYLSVVRERCFLGELERRQAQNEKLRVQHEEEVKTSKRKAADRLLLANSRPVLNATAVRRWKWALSMVKIANNLRRNKSKSTWKPSSVNYCHIHSDCVCNPRLQDTLATLQENSGLAEPQLLNCSLDGTLVKPYVAVIPSNRFQDALVLITAVTMIGGVVFMWSYWANQAISSVIEVTIRATSEWINAVVKVEMKESYQAVFFNFITMSLGISNRDRPTYFIRFSNIFGYIGYGDALNSCEYANIGFVEVCNASTATLTRYSVGVDELLNVSSVLNVYAPYRPSLRSFYLGASSENGTHGWTAPYLFPDGISFGMTSVMRYPSIPFLNVTTGVLTGGVYLSTLRKFVQNIDFGNVTASVNILDRSTGLVIASSLDTLRPMANCKSGLFSTADRPLIAQAVAPLVRRFGPEYYLPNWFGTINDQSGNRVLVSIQSAAGMSLPWTILTQIEEASFAKPLQDNTNLAISAAFLCLILMVTLHYFVVESWASQDESLEPEHKNEAFNEEKYFARWLSPVVKNAFRNCLRDHGVGMGLVKETRVLQKKGRSVVRVHEENAFVESKSHMEVVARLEPQRSPVRELAAAAEQEAPCASPEVCGYLSSAGSREHRR